MKAKISMLLCLALLLTCLTGTFTAFAAEGSGTSTDPYIISSAEDFMAIANAPDAYYELAKDLVLDSYTPFGFAGVLNGNGHTIEVTISATESDYVGLFSRLYATNVHKVEIKNLTVDGSITGGNYVGGIAGVILHDRTAGFAVDNKIEISNCINKADITGVSNVGGIIGRWAGLNGNTGFISSCVNSGTITASSTEKVYFGGISGYFLDSKSTLSYLGNTGAINASGNDNVAGIVGYLASTGITDSYNKATVTARYRSGGIIGNVAGEGELTNLFNAGTVTASVRFGGIAGNCENANRVFENCYVTQKFTSDARAICGRDEDSVASFKNCYYISTTESAEEGLTALTADEMKVQSNFIGFDFTNDWEMGETSYKYPILKNVQYPSESGLKPIPVSSIDDFKAIADNPTAYYEIVDDINLGSYTPFAFAGVIDGNNHTLTVNISVDSDYVGLFSRLYATTATKVELKNIKVAGFVTGNNYVGGLVGAVYHDRASGFAVDNLIEIKNCTNEATITGVGFVGGIIGRWAGLNGLTGGLITECINIGEIKASSTGANYFGGIAGQFNDAKATMSYLGNIGNISVSENNNVAGISGYVQASIEKCYNTANITAQYRVGGIIGNVEGTGTIKNLFNTGTITASERFGGISGNSMSSEKVFENCYSTQKFASDVRAICGRDQDSAATFVNCYYISDTVSSEEGLTALTADEMKVQSEFIGFDFTNDWEMGNAAYKYPILKNAVYPASLNFKAAEISSAEDFMDVSENPTGYYELKNNITLGDYTPFAFAGIFNGNGYTINLAIDKTDVDNIGLFSVLYGAANIENVIIDGTVKGKNYVGGIAGIVNHTAGTYEVTGDITIDNCINKASISGVSYIGGIIGKFGHSNSKIATVSNCLNTGVITGSGSQLGGIAGSMSIAVVSDTHYIKNCGNTGAVNGNASASTMVAGISGEFHGAIENSYNAGNITGLYRVGGIVGSVAYGYPAKNLFNTGVIKGSQRVGGIAGNTNNYRNYENCYNAYMVLNANQAISGEQSEFLNPPENAENYTNCFSLSDTAYVADNGISFVTEAAMKTQSTFSGFDFTNDWEMGSNSYTYPKLRNLKYPEGSVFNPKTISDESEFDEIRNNPEGIYSLTESVVLSDDYVPFKFSGKLYGNDNTIEVNIVSSNSNTGLFSQLDKNAYIGNLTITGNITAASSDSTLLSGIGALAGSISSTGNGIIIENVISDVQFDLTDCRRVGGIVGDSYVTEGIITYRNLVNNSNIILKGEQYVSEVGGILGIAGAYSPVTASVNNGNIYAKDNVGGIVGFAYGNIDNCYNTANVTSNTGAGGIAGYMAGSKTISNCYNTGDITNTYSSGYVGGIAGHDLSGGATIINCYNIGNVASADKSVNELYGIIGIQATGKAETVVTNSYFVTDKDAAGKGIKTTFEELKTTVLGDAYEISSNDYPYPQLKAVSNENAIAFVKVNTPVAENGTVYANKEYSKTGSEITITVIPDEYYVVSSLLINSMEVSADIVKNKYVLTETPASEVIVNTVFAIDTSMPEAPVSGALYNEKYDYINPFEIAGLTTKQKCSFVGKYAVVSFAEINKGNLTYELADYGFIFSQKIAEPVDGNSLCYKKSSYVEDGNLKIGGLFVGNIEAAYDCYVRPYAVYKNSTTNEETIVYGSTMQLKPIVMENK